LIRRVLRQRRLGKAYSPPSSPLLNAISDPLPSGIERSMSQRSVMGTGRSEFWSSSDSSTMIGTAGGYRSEMNASSVGGGSVMSGFGNQSNVSNMNALNGNGGGYRGEFGGGEIGRGLDLKDGWDERMVIPPLSPLPPAASPEGRVEKEDGMRFEMIGDTKFGVNEKPLGGRGPLGENPPSF
jgi:hypothetical protein